MIMGHGDTEAWDLATIWRGLANLRNGDFRAAMSFLTISPTHIQRLAGLDGVSIVWLGLVCTVQVARSVSICIILSFFFSM